MGESLRVHAACRAALNAVIADRRRRAQTFFQVAGIQKVAARRGVCPDSCEAIRLQLQQHRILVCGPWLGLLRLPYLPLDSQSSLHMMADLMR